MIGTGGFRKLRWRDESRKGRRGGLRIIYYYFVSEYQIWFMSVYGKNEAIDLTPKEKKMLREAVTAELVMRAKGRAIRLDKHRGRK
jgi:hypothetical protein